MSRTTTARVTLLLCGLAAILAPAAEARSLKALYAFQNTPDGAQPAAPLIRFAGKLYGTTLGGGAYGDGTVFSLDPKSGAETIVYSFQGGNDGANPQSALLNVGNTLYGTTTYGGGPNNNGTVFAVAPFAGTEQVVHAFGSGNDGVYPEGGLLDDQLVLYGTTFEGGDAGLGTIYSINLISGAEQVLYSFQGGSDGADPSAGFINANGTFYSTTSYGGGGACSNGCGTVFLFDPASGAEQVLYAFLGGADGIYPNAGLTSAGGRLFGTTVYGGAAGAGTVFSVSPNIRGADQIDHYFLTAHGDGQAPFAGLTDMSGTLYGTTAAGGRDGHGSIFSLDPHSGAEQVLYSFAGGGAPGAPEARLFQHDGALYGTAANGGDPLECGNGCGYVFKFTP